MANNPGPSRNFAKSNKAPADWATQPLSHLLQTINFDDILPWFDYAYGVSKEEEAQRQRQGYPPGWRWVWKVPDETLQSDFTEWFWFGESSNTQTCKSSSPIDDATVQQLLSNWTAIFQFPPPTNNSETITDVNDSDDSHESHLLEKAAPDEGYHSYDTNVDLQSVEPNNTLPQPSDSSEYLEQHHETLASYPPMPKSKKLELLGRLKTPPTRSVVHLEIPNIPYILSKTSSIPKNPPSHIPQEDYKTIPLEPSHHSDYLKIIAWNKALSNKRRNLQQHQQHFRCSNQTSLSDSKILRRSDRLLRTDTKLLRRSDRLGVHQDTKEKQWYTVFKTQKFKNEP